MAESTTESSDPRLDVLSPQFDPVQALHADSVKLPFPQIGALENLKQYQALISGKAPRRGGRRPAVAEPRQEEKSVVSVKDGPAVNKKEINLKTVLDYMNDAPGPMSLLQRCYQTQCEVLVWIRHSAGLRGVCLGRLVVFDRHFNMVLSNVTEYFTPMRTRSNCGIERKKRRKPHSTKHSATNNDTQLCTGDLQISNDTKTGVKSDEVEKKSYTAAQAKFTDTSQRTHSSTRSDAVMFAGRSWEKKRTARQIFIRGDNIVLVSPSSSPEHAT